MSFAAEPDSPAEQVCAASTVADFADHAALERFAAAVDIATFEFENIPAEAVHWVAARKPVLPRPEILEITQDRLREKDFLRSIDVDDRGLSRSLRRRLAGPRDARFRLSGGAQERAPGL